MSDYLLTTQDLDSWLRQLRGARKSAQTLRSYQLGVEAFMSFCDSTSRPCELSKRNVLDWLDYQHLQASASVRLRLISVKLFAKWLAAEDGFDADSIVTIKPPKLDQAPVADISDDELRRMMKLCDGKQLRDKRDKAILMLLAETGLRAAELLGLDVNHVDLDACWLTVVKGKGGKSRRVRFSPETASAIDSYARARRNAVQRPAEGGLWVSERGRRLTYTGLVSSLKERAEDAGVIGFHVHRLRHTAAVRWLASGGSETGLRARAGWASNAMVERYTKTASERLAGDEFSRLNLAVRDV